MNQNKFVDYLDRHFSNIAEWSVNHRLLVVLLSLLMLGVGGFYMTKVRFDGSLESFFEKSDPVYASYIQYLDEFLSDEVTYILYEVPDSVHGPFDIEAMKTIAKLTQTLEDEVPFVREATSLANVEFMYAEGDELIVDDLLRDFPENQQKLLEIKQRVMSKPAYVDYLINEQGNYAAIYLEMSAASPDPLEKIIDDPEKGEALDNLYPQASDIKVREILNRPEFADVGIKYYLTGDVPMNSVYNHLYMEDSAKISLITLGFIALVSFLLLHTNVRGLLAPISVVVLSVIMMMGVIGMIGWTVGLFITMAPSLICAIGVAQAVHILQEYQRSMTLQGDKNTAVKEAIKKVGAPCLLAALTTAAGFMVMAVSELQGLAEFGIYSAIGVMFTFILSMTLLVVFLGGRKSKKDADQEKATATAKKGTLKGVNPMVKGIVELSIKLDQRYPKIIIGFFAVILVWSLAGISKLSIDFNFLDEFEDHVQWKQDTLLADDVMGGIMAVSYIIETNRENGIKDVELLKALDKVQQFAETIPEVKKSFAVTDIIKDLNRSFHNDDPAYYRIPDNQELLSQYLLVYEVSGGEELSELVNIDFSRTVLDMRVIMTEASKIRSVIAQIDAFAAQNPLPGAEMKPTGIGLLWVRIADYISHTQIFTYSLIFIIIAAAMVLAYGSLRLGILAMVPNVTPIVITLGAMGWLDIHLDYMKLLLATIAIGIAVDDTIHLVTRFRSRFFQCGNYNEALAAALRDVGPALVITTFILIVGFGGYLFTDLAVLSHFGILLGATIGIALVADLLLMPVIISTIKPMGPEMVQAPQQDSPSLGGEPASG